MVISKKDKILIESLYERYTQTSKQFPQKNWTKGGFDSLITYYCYL